jgi:hypothetical protein
LITALTAIALACPLWADSVDLAGPEVRGPGLGDFSGGPRWRSDLVHEAAFAIAPRPHAGLRSYWGAAPWEVSASSYHLGYELLRGGLPCYALGGAPWESWPGNGIDWAELLPAVEQEERSHADWLLSDR